MKILAIALLAIGTLTGIKELTSNLKLQLIVLKEWKNIFEFWRDQIEQYAVSVPELLEKTVNNPLFCKYKILGEFKSRDIQTIIDFVISDSYIIAKTEKTVISETLQKLGGSLIDAQIRDLTLGITTLDRMITLKEKNVKERCTVIYKLAPLISAAIAVILW